MNILNHFHLIKFFQKCSCLNFKIATPAMLGLWLLLLGLVPINAFAQPLAKDLDKFLGGATSSELYRYFDRFWNQITPGNDGKWGSVEVVREQYNWANLDKIYSYATKRNIPFKEHTFIWGQQQPGWMASLDTASQRAQVEEWIQQFCNRYPNITYVDVVNEPLHAPPVYKDALGGEGKTGWDWVITAFKLARKYCAPGVKLHLNEYNILHSNTATNDYLRLIDTLKVRGLIDGIGIQGHYFEFRSDLRATSNVYVHNINTIKSNLDRLAATGLPIYITEFDIDEDVDANQLAQYKIYFPIFWYHPAVKGITFWGYIQGDVWTSHPYTYLLLSNGTERPALQWLRSFIKSPSAPAPISPNGAGGIPRNPTLVWHTAATATSYHVQVASNNIFATTIKDTTVTDTLLFLNPLDANRRYFWRVSGINEYGESDFSVSAGFQTGDQISAIEDLEKMPTAFKLFQNYPNPFNPTTAITFNLPQGSEVRLVLINILGEEIMEFTAGNFEAGVHSVQLNASRLTSGVYFYRLHAGSFISTKKLVLMR